MSSLEDRLRAYFAGRAADPSLAALDREKPPPARPYEEPPRNRRRVLAAAGVAAVVAGLAGVLVLVVTRDDTQDNREVHAGPVPSAPTTTAIPTPTPDPNAPFRWPDQCLPPTRGSGTVAAPDVLSDAPVASWTSSEPGEWLRARLQAAGIPEPYSAGSAWVAMHGVDGVVFVWIGPPDNTAGLTLREVDGVETAELVPEEPFDNGAYRAAYADTVVAGGVRLWFLTHPRDAYEEINFPGLTTAPCLPDQTAIRQLLRVVVSAANEQPYEGRLPAGAGRLRVAPNEGISITQPGDQHLIQVGERVLGRTLTLPGFTGALLAGFDVFVYTVIPPSETGSAYLASTEFPFDDSRTAAGGLDVLLYIQRAGSPQPEAANREDLRTIAAALNRDPFLGQPVP